MSLYSCPACAVVYEYNHPGDEIGLVCPRCSEGRGFFPPLRKVANVDRPELLAIKITDECMAIFESTSLIPTPLPPQYDKARALLKARILEILRG